MEGFNARMKILRCIVYCALYEHRRYLKSVTTIHGSAVTIAICQAIPEL